MTASRSSLKAIIFDLDGIIVDSEPVQLDAFNETLKPYQIHWSEKDFKELIGMTQMEIFGKVREMNHIQESIDSLASRKKEIYTQLIKTRLKPMPGFIELFNWVEHAHLKNGIASGSPLHDILAVLDLIQLQNRFDYIQSSLDLPHSKPFPDVYLQVASKLAVEPPECVVLEDTTIGVTAATRAGMLAIAVPNSFTSHQDFTQAHYIVEDLFAARTLIESLYL